MYADELTIKTLLKNIRTSQRMLKYAIPAASAAALRVELAAHREKLDWMEAELSRICTVRSWELPAGSLPLPNLNIHRLRKGNLTDSAISQLLIRDYLDVVIRGLQLLHRLPYRDLPIETAVKTACDRLFGCIFRLQEYL